MTDTAQHLKNLSRKRVPVIRESRVPVAKAADIAGPEWMETNRAALDAAGAIQPVGDVAASPSALIQAVLNSASGTVTMPGGSGTYAMATGLTIPAGVTLDLNGATLDFSAMTTPAPMSSSVYSGGILTDLPALSETVALHSTTVTFAADHGLDIGDWITVYNPADGSFNTDRPYYRDGQWMLVTAVVDAVTVRIEGRARSTFPTSCTVHKLAPAGGSITNGRIIGTAGTWGITYDLAADFTLSSLVIEGAENGLVQVFRSVDFSITGIHGNSKLSGPAGVGNNYGIILGNCQDFLVSDNRVHAQWHAFSTGGGTGPGCVPCRDGQVTSNVFRTAGNISACDTHGNTEDVTFTANTIDGGISIGGDYITYRGNTVFGGSGQMPVQTGNEVLGGNIVLEGNMFHVQSGGVAGQGFIQLRLYAALTRPGGTLTIRDNIIITNDYQGPSGSTSVIQVYNIEGAAIINLDISGNDIRSAVDAPTAPASYFDIMLRCAVGKAFGHVRIHDHNGGRGGIRGTDLNCILLDVARLTSRSCADINGGIYINDNPTPVYSVPNWQFRDLNILNPYAQTMRLIGLPGALIELRDGILLNGNIKNDASVATGANLLIQGADKVTARGMTWGSSNATRRLALVDIGTFVEADNETVGSVTTDYTSNVGTRRAPQ